MSENNMIEILSDEEKTEIAEKKKKLINKEKRRLVAILKYEEIIADNSKDATDESKAEYKEDMKKYANIIDELAFLKVFLNDLKDDINKNGFTSRYKNGENQYGTKKSPAVETYNSTLKNYTTLLRQFHDLFGKSIGAVLEDGFTDFLAKRK